MSESSVRKYVRERKLTLGLVARETFVPQHYDWGGEAQVDWYQADAELEGERVPLRVFVMRSMASGAAFHRAYLHGTQQAFWRLTNTHLRILVGSSISCAMTISVQR